MYLHAPHAPGFHQASTAFRLFLSQSTERHVFPLERLHHLRQSASNATGWNDLKRVITERAQRNVILELPRLLPRARRCKYWDASLPPMSCESTTDAKQAFLDDHSATNGVEGPTFIADGSAESRARKELGSAVTDSPSPHGTQGRRVRQLATAGMKVRSAWLQRNASSSAADGPRSPVRDGAPKRR